jgi:serine/threonine protein kinase
MSATPDGRVASTKRAETDADRVRLRTEATVLAELRHPNVVELLDEDVKEGVIRTAFCARTTLASTPPGSMHELASVAESLVTIVSELHRLGWAHAGLSPDHCLVANGNRIVLCSFGRARRIGGPTHPAARGDRDAVRAMLAAWRAGLPPSRHRHEREASARLDRVVASTGASLPLFRRPSPHEDAPPPVASPVVHRPNDEQPVDDDSMRPALARAAVYGLVLVGLLLVHPPASAIPGTGSLLATTASWTVAIGRPVALYGLVVSIVCAVAVRTRRERLLWIGRRLAPTRFRRIVTGVALAGAVSTIASHLTAPSPSGGVVVAAPRPESPTSAPIPTTTSTTTTSTTVPQAAPAIGSSDTVATTPVTATPVTTPPVGQPLRWTIGAGDHLWRVAEQSLMLAWGRRPTSLETDTYWRSLIAANRMQLADPRNPDLVFVGQVFDLPPIPPAAADQAA